MLAHSFQQRELHQRFKPSANSLSQDGQPWIVLNPRIEIIEARMPLPNGPQEIRWAV